MQVVVQDCVKSLLLYKRGHFYYQQPVCIDVSSNTASFWGVTCTTYQCPLVPNPECTLSTTFTTATSTANTCYTDYNSYDNSCAALVRELKALNEVFVHQ